MSEETSSKEWVIDLSAWTTMRHIIEWQSLNAYEIPRFIAIMAQHIKSWEFEGDPSEPESYANLSPKEFQLALNKMSLQAVKIFRAA